MEQKERQQGEELTLVFFFWQVKQANLLSFSARRRRWCAGMLGGCWLWEACRPWDLAGAWASEAGRKGWEVSWVDREGEARPSEVDGTRPSSDWIVGGDLGDSSLISHSLVDSPASKTAGV